MAERLLEVSNLVKHFPMGRRQTVKAINDVSFHIDRGETLALVGESGSGKTTVGRCILRLIEPTEGRIRFAGAQVDTMSANQLRALRPRVQMVFQEPYDSLNPRMRIRKIVEEPILLGGDMTPAQRHDRVAEVLEMVRLRADSMDKYPHQFSAGEQQRIGIARAIATEPELVVLDEPTSALDVSVRAEILDLLTDLQEDLALSYLLISHDLTAVRRICHRVAIMYLGKIVERGNADELFEQPLHPYSRALLSSVLYPDPSEQLSRFLLSGEIPSPIDLPPGLSSPRPLPLGCRHLQRCLSRCGGAASRAPRRVLPGARNECSERRYGRRKPRRLTSRATDPLRHERFHTLTGGCRPAQGCACSSWLASLRSTSSPPERAPSWIPIGKPSSVQWRGTLIAGCPETL